MLTLTIELKGAQTETHCSMTSGIAACEKLGRESERCLMFKEKLKYDWNAHAYKRCDQCKKSEVEDA
ncbi:hypothetical protein DEAC_c40310 [Desulfosporosinus acididurans]|uniref:Uncharacterized protein n=1 Tax=Desulfosporosinus acididurans TaxID=476652 RepID=A0A0J1FKY4_9FIRM|nr:hypothetical protein DEAC_c40310 [Desulfosporosinus acididurans]